MAPYSCYLAATERVHASGFSLAAAVKVSALKQSK